MDELIERSSLGTAAAKKIRSSTDASTVVGLIEEARRRNLGVMAAPDDVRDEQVPNT